ncbi:MAG: aldolase/citrate lyase family protein [Phycisphaerae bacterium]
MSYPQHAEAGRRGADVRSDCWVRLTQADSGGIKIGLQSKVESMYGDAIRTLIRDMLAAFGIANARVEMEDAGALPFVLMARVEAAVRRLGVKCGTGTLPVKDDWPSFAPHAQYPTERDRFRRSRLYLPGNEPKFMLNAGLHGPDGVILDLEDSVAPTVKDEARLLVRNALRSIDFCSAERMVRINPGDRGIEDLDFIVAHNVHVILIPKVESPDQVTRIDDRVKEILKNAPNTGRAVGLSPRGAPNSRRPGTPRTAAPAEAGGSSAAPNDQRRPDPRPPVFLMPIIESALGAIRACEIATASPNVVALTIGLEDYTADIGAERTADGRESFWARSQVVNAARAAGVQPIDTVFSDVGDMDGLRRSVLEARSLGFDGKGCIHPRQIRVVHEAFAPTKAELEKAQSIVAAFEEAQARGLAAVSLGSKMIDPPVVKRAQRIVKLAKAMAMIQ